MGTSLSWAVAPHAMDFPLPKSMSSQSLLPFVLYVSEAPQTHVQNLFLLSGSLSQLKETQSAMFPTAEAWEWPFTPASASLSP